MATNSTIKNLVKQSDLFGLPVYLTYKGEKEFSTVLGGILSILLMLMFVGYSIDYIYKEFTDPSFNISRSEVIYNYYENTEADAIVLDTSLNTMAIAVEGYYDYNSQSFEEMNE